MVYRRPSFCLFLAEWELGERKQKFEFSEEMSLGPFELISCNPLLASDVLGRKVVEAKRGGAKRYNLSGNCRSGRESPRDPPRDDSCVFFGFRFGQASGPTILLPKSDYLSCWFLRVVQQSLKGGFEGFFGNFVATFVFYDVHLCPFVFELITQV